MSYVLTEGVIPDIEAGLFKRPKPTSSSGKANPMILALLQRQVSLIKGLMEKVKELSSMPERKSDSIWSLHGLNRAYNHPKWLSRVHHFLKCAVFRAPLLVENMRMSTTDVIFLSFGAARAL